MLSYENSGISGNGQKSPKRGKFHKWNDEKLGGGKRGGSGNDEDSRKERLSQKIAGSWISLVHFPWTGKNLEKAREGGLGIIPIEDQFRAVSGAPGNEYASYHFNASPTIKVHGEKLKIFGKDCEGITMSLELELAPNEIILECTYEFLVVIWVARKRVLKST